MWVCRDVSPVGRKRAAGVRQSTVKKGRTGRSLGDLARAEAWEKRFNKPGTGVKRHATALFPGKG